jgi:CheY-like chemotaxis protein
LKLTVGQRILFGYGLAMLFMALTGIAGYRGTERLLLANYWVRHTYSVISEAKGIHAALLQFESSRRGYLITGDASYLEPRAGLLRRLADSLRFSVVDTGIGISADKTEMIFGRFNQADSSTTRKYGGTGLGLAISKGLAELMGGRIACSSEVGKGSTFFVTVPFGIRREMETAKPVEAAPIALPAAESPSQKAAIRILIAEDSEYNLALLKAYLKDSGFELDFAANGQIAVDKVISGHPDLVLMDLQMPLMDGLEATRVIRQWEAATQARPIPILALTAHAAGDGAGWSLEAGCTEHLTKPIKKATLLEAIARHLSGKIRITPPEGIESLVPAYLANLRRDMSEILAGADSKGCELARRLGHQFKGEGESYGFPEITRTGAAVELAAMADDADEIRNQILALSTYLDRVEIVV